MLQVTSSLELQGLKEKLAVSTDALDRQKHDVSALETHLIVARADLNRAVSSAEVRRGKALS